MGFVTGAVELDPSPSPYPASVLPAALCHAGALLYPSSSPGASTGTATVLRRANAPADHNPHFITSHVVSAEVKQGKSGCDRAALLQLSENTLSAPVLEVLNQSSGFCSSFIILFYICVFNCFFLFSHSYNCRIRQHLSCVLLPMSLMGDLITRSPW